MLSVFKRLIALVYIKGGRGFLGMLSLFIVSSLLFSLLFFNPADASWCPPCPFHYITGLYCPGCGSLRAVHHLFCGSFLTAFDLNPLMVLFLPLLTCIILSYLLFILTGKQLLSLQFVHSGKFVWMIFWFIIIYWVLRNIPCFPFSFLVA